MSETFNNLIFLVPRINIPITVCKQIIIDCHSKILISPRCCGVILAIRVGVIKLISTFRYNILGSPKTIFVRRVVNISQCVFNLFILRIKVTLWNGELHGRHSKTKICECSFGNCKCRSSR